jgi:hypothetical protein
MEISDTQEVESAIKPRRRDSTLQRRTAKTPQAATGERGFRCGRRKTPIKIKPYPGPSLLVRRKEAGKEVPIMVPGMKHKDAQRTPDRLTVKQSSNIKDVVIPKPPYFLLIHGNDM